VSTDVSAHTAAPPSTTARGSRDRYVDLLRIISIAAVVVGHCIIAVVTFREGRFEGRNLLALSPASQILTWFLQVMPVFFVVGGFSNASSWAQAQRRHDGYAAWLYGRASRLLRPTTVFVGVWVVAAALVQAAGLGGPNLDLVTSLVAVPLWFLAAYLGVVALAPMMLAAHRRAGLLVPVLLLAGIVAADVAKYAFGLTAVAYINYLLVWLLAQQLGVIWHAGKLDHPVTAWAVAVGGLGALIALTGLGPYPFSMVAVPGSAASNTSPPTVALAALLVYQTGLALLGRRPLTRWLERPNVWAKVVSANTIAMTVYLWHLTAVVIAGAILMPVGFPQPVPGTTVFWLFRVLWIAAVALVIVPMVWLFGRFERPAKVKVRSRVGFAGLAAAVLGVVAVCFGLLRLVLGGLHVEGWIAGAPIGAALTLLVGVVLLGVSIDDRASG